MEEVTKNKNLEVPKDSYVKRFFQSLVGNNTTFLRGQELSFKWHKLTFKRRFSFSPGRICDRSMQGIPFFCLVKTNKQLQTKRRHHHHHLHPSIPLHQGNKATFDRSMAALAEKVRNYGVYVLTIWPGTLVRWVSGGSLVGREGMSSIELKETSVRKLE